MRKIKASSSYLKNQTRKNLAKAALCMLGTVSVLVALGYGLIFPLPYGLSTSNLIVLLPELIAIIALLAGFYYFQRKYQVFNGGWQGEKQVVKILSHNLSDDYYLINDLYLQGGGGDIDHVVLAPAGVFVLETKNWSGNISVNGDDWHRDRSHAAGSSPSNQVKRNTQKIRNILDHSSNLRGLGVWVEGIVVIVNKHASLHLNNPTVPVVVVQDLPNYIKNRGSQRRLSKEQRELIGKEVAKQKA
jgi:hypothetical protein